MEGYRRQGNLALSKARETRLAMWRPWSMSISTYRLHYASWWVRHYLPWYLRDAMWAKRWRLAWGLHHLQHRWWFRWTGWHTD